MNIETPIKIRRVQFSGLSTEDSFGIDEALTSKNAKGIYIFVRWSIIDS